VRPISVATQTAGAANIHRLPNARSRRACAIAKSAGNNERYAISSAAATVASAVLRPPNVVIVSTSQ
jgi:hypothetical protein